MEISPDLHEFLSAWHQWATAEVVEDSYIFNRDTGLCACLHYWCTKMGKDHVQLNLELLTRLEAQFKSNAAYPFDKNLNQYWQNKSAASVNPKKKGMHLNPQRVKWVKEQIRFMR